MFFKQFYLGCLSQAAYMIGDAGEAAVIDPLRDVEPYLDEAAANGLQIRYVIETHLHADFVSGHRELAERTGATILLGRHAAAQFEFVPLADGDEIRMGAVVLRVLETPGHTPEHICLLVTDENVGPTPQKMLTGDTLFIGDVGRPDLVAARGRSAVEMAGLLFDSIREKILPWPDEIEIYPGHGAGSLCGRKMSEATMGTLGTERQQNPMLQPMSREEFIDRATADQLEVPEYFKHAVRLNMAGADALDGLPEPVPMTAETVAAHLRGEATLGVLPWILDTRDAWGFGDGHIPGALNIGLDGRFAMWAGAIIPPNQPLILVLSGPGKVREAVLRLARVGHHGVIGFLDGGMDAWRHADRAIMAVPQLIADEFADRRGEFQLLDVRRQAEFRTGAIAGAVNVPLAELDPSALSAAGHIDRSKPVAVICNSGHRSSLASSLLCRTGFATVVNLAGGIQAWRDFDFELVTP